MDPNQHHNALNRNDMLHWYEIQSILGQGGFGITYLARDTNLDQLVAIKEYLPSEFSTRDQANTVQPISENHTEIFHWGKKRFLEEAKTLAQFKHPNVVRVSSFFENNNTGYMVMDYEDGTDLSELIKSGETFDEKRILALMLPILDGLGKIHARGFIHRDIKPANIFIRTDGSPVLIDFGSARQAIGGQTKTMTSLVTPGYAPFEQYHDAEGKQGPWTDIYSLGATCYCMLTGKPPTDALKRGMARLDHSTDAYLHLTDLRVGNCSEHLLQAIDHALEFKETDRPRDLAEWGGMLSGKIPVPQAAIKTQLGASATDAAGPVNDGHTQVVTQQTEQSTVTGPDDGTVTAPPAVTKFEKTRAKPPPPARPAAATPQGPTTPQEPTTPQAPAAGKGKAMPVAIILASIAVIMVVLVVVWKTQPPPVGESSSSAAVGLEAEKEALRKEQARIAAQAKQLKEDKARIAAEEKQQAELARQTAETQAEEQAGIAEETQAQEQARIAAEQKDLQQQKAQIEADKKLQAKLQAKQATEEKALRKEQARIAEETQRKAELAAKRAAEKKRKAQQAAKQAAEKQRQAELAAQKAAEKQRQADIAAQQLAEQKREQDLLRQQAEELVLQKKLALKEAARDPFGNVSGVYTPDEGFEKLKLVQIDNRIKGEIGKKGSTLEGRREGDQISFVLNYSRTGYGFKEGFGKFTISADGKRLTGFRSGAGFAPDTSWNFSRKAK